MNKWTAPYASDPDWVTNNVGDYCISIEKLANGYEWSVWKKGELFTNVSTGVLPTLNGAKQAALNYATRLNKGLNTAISDHLRAKREQRKAMRNEPKVAHDSQATTAIRCAIACLDTIAAPSDGVRKAIHQLKQLEANQ